MNSKIKKIVICAMMGMFYNFSLGAKSQIAQTAPPVKRMSDKGFIRYDRAELLEGELAGVPLGGIGAGKIEVNNRGEIINIATVNNLRAAIGRLPLTGFWVKVEDSQGTIVAPLSLLDSDFEGAFPFTGLIIRSC